MKIGRNDPCPCGSGKKYKKCCLDKDRFAEQKEQERPTENYGGENSVTPQGDSYSSVKSPLIEKLEELLLRGPLRAKSAVEVNSKVPLDMIEEAPVIPLLQVFLESIVASGGRVPFKRDGRVGLDEEILQQTAKRWPGVDPSISSKTGSSLFPLHLYYVETLAYEMGCIGKGGDEIGLTEKGIEVIRNTKLRRVYTSGLNKLTYTYNWFAHTGLPDKVVEIQEICGILLFLLDYSYRNEEAVDENNILGQVDSILPFTQRFSSHQIDKKTLSRLIHDFFFGGYCYLFGFLVPSAEGKSKGSVKWYVSDLYNKMFRWKL